MKSRLEQARDYMLRSFDWFRRHVPPGLRSVLGVLFVVGGVLGFLPVLGFWMLPLGVALLWVDLRRGACWVKGKWRGRKR